MSLLFLLRVYKLLEMPNFRKVTWRTMTTARTLTAFKCPTVNIQSWMESLVFPAPRLLGPVLLHRVRELLGGPDIHQSPNVNVSSSISHTLSPMFQLKEERHWSQMFSLLPTTGYFDILSSAHKFRFILIFFKNTRIYQMCYSNLSWSIFETL